jgi:hypothetical protein
MEKLKSFNKEKAELLERCSVKEVLHITDFSQKRSK